MTHLCLNHCMVLHVHQERTDALDLNSFVKEFAQANERRIAFFRHLKKNFFDHKKYHDLLTCYNEFFLKYKN